MSNLLSYKKYNGTVEYSKEDSCLFGKVIGRGHLNIIMAAANRNLERQGTEKHAKEL